MKDLIRFERFCAERIKQITTMDHIDIVTAIMEAVNNGKKMVDISYRTSTTFTNNEQVDVLFGGKQLYHIDGDDPTEFSDILSSLVSDIAKSNEALKDAHVVSRKQQFVFRYSGWSSSVSNCMAPYAISLNPVSKERKKTGKVTAHYSMVSNDTVMKTIKEHPDYELYVRSGFSFRGAGEGRTDIEGVKRLLNWACVVDMDIIDDEIHLNGFSVNDME